MTNERTIYEAIIDIRFGQRFNELNQRFYERVDLFFGAVQLLMGSAAAASLFGGDANVIKWAGAFLALTAVLERLVGAGRKAGDFAHARATWGELDSRSSAMTLEQLDAEIRRLQTTLPPGIVSLSIPAYNATMRSHGHVDDVQRLTLMQWMASAIC